MKLNEIGEFGLIDRFSPQFLQNLPENIVGIGDDCAVITLDNDESLLVTTDMLIENSHFLRNKISPEDLGYKSLAVNLSDIAAMGGIPDNAFLSIGIPSDIDVEWLDGFFTGLKDLAQHSSVRLLGGDTTRSQKYIIINVVILGRMPTAQVKYRSGATSGDDIFLTGFIGNSATGLKIILDGKPSDIEADYLINAHNRPRPHLAEGRWLAAEKSVHAMIDVSDGIDSDLQRIMEKSGCGANINLEALPITGPMEKICRQYDWNGYEIAATGGEDYCLLLTVENAKSKQVAKAFSAEFNRELFHIGTITGDKNHLNYFLDKKIIKLKEHGFDHFINKGT